ncbi:MAG: FAD-dependent oxidoreductase [Actinomycetota bacterium]|nr:FAD-dependent oxidoreductase [Actinomycetota bacterium]
MPHRYPHLLASGQIGALELRNRIVMPAMDQNNCTSDGLISDATVTHYEERAAGGAGMLILETSAVSWPHGAHSLHQPSLSHDGVVEGLARLAERVHVHGARILVQACHHGKTSGLDIAAGLPALVPSVPPPPTAPGGMMVDTTDEELMRMATLTGGRIPEHKEATDTELVAVVEAFGQAARRVAAAGMDGLEVHAAHGYLISTFLSPAWNRRKDRWGGSPENRARLLCEVVAAVRAHTGPGFAIVVRLDGQEYGVNDGITPDSAAITAQLAEAAGADAIHVSATSSDGTGVGFTAAPLPWKPGQYADYARTVRRAVDIPVIAVGRLAPDLAERLIARGGCDFVAMGRQLLADPDLPLHLVDGRPEMTRPCINCFVCVARNFWSGEPVCAVNPRLGHYDEPEPQPTSSPRHVVVVGGGPAGMECARVAAGRGHRVTLIERSKQLGGTARFSAMTTPANGDLVHWFEAALDDLGVEVHRGIDADPEVIAALEPDVLVVATGATRTRPAVPGSDLPHVLSGDDLRELLAGSEAVSGSALGRLIMAGARRIGLLDDLDRLRSLSRIWLPLGRRVVVVGGGLVGVELAHFLAERGRQVTVLEETNDLGVEMAHPRRWRTLHEARALGVIFETEARLVAVDGDYVHWRRSTDQQSIRADTVILATGVQTDPVAAERFADLGVEVHVVGDRATIGYIEGAVRTGNQVGRVI